MVSPKRARADNIGKRIEAAQPLFELMLFGTMDARVDGVSLQRSLPAKGKLLLAFLAINPGRPVASSVIADSVFPDSQAIDPHEIIKKTVQDVRKALGSEALRLVTPAPRMFALNLEGATCDWLIFHSALKEASPESLKHAANVQSRVFLESETYPWVIAEQTRCLLLRQSALDKLFLNAMDRADLAAAGHLLSQQLVIEAAFVSVNEESWRLLLTALLKRQEYGLLHHYYSLLKTFLEHTSGRPPEPATIAIYQAVPKQILRQLVQPKPRARKTLLPDSARLPTYPYALLGREEELRELSETFTQTRLISIVGIGGIGKTRFAVQAAGDIAVATKEDAGFIDLAPCLSGDIVRAIAACLGVKENPCEALIRALKDFISTKRLLIILDNCEHVVEAVAPVCVELLRDCPNLRLICTSREALRVDGEHVFSLNPLSLPLAATTSEVGHSRAYLEICRHAPSVRLFGERALAVLPGFRLTQHNSKSVVDLCRLVDGLPLGIEMIASQVASLPLERILEDLSNCILHLKHHKRGITQRHQTLLAALDWSYGILTAAEQMLVRRLSVVPGGCTVLAAQQICSDSLLPADAIPELLGDLVSKSLLLFADTDGKTSRFSFLETVRVYANDRLRLAGERDYFKIRYLDYFVLLAEEADQNLSGADQKQWLERMDSDYSNLRAALALSLEQDHVCGQRLGYSLSRYWEIRGFYSEAKEWLTILVSHSEACDTSEVHGRLLQAAGWFHHITGKYEIARALLEQSLEILHRHENRVDASVTLIKLGFVAFNQREMEKARSLFLESLAIRRELKDKRLIAIALVNLGIVATELSDYALGQTYYREALTNIEEVGDRRMKANCLTCLGYLAQHQSDFLSAILLLEESVSILRDIGDKYLLRYTLLNLGAAAYGLDYLELARDSYVECLKLSHEGKIPMSVMSCLESLANVAVKQQQWDRGAQLWGAAEAMSTSLGSIPTDEQISINSILVSNASAALGKDRFELALETGRSLSEAAAVELALGAPLD